MLKPCKKLYIFFQNIINKYEINKIFTFACQLLNYKKHKNSKIHEKCSKACVNITHFIKARCN